MNWTAVNNCVCCIWKKLYMHTYVRKYQYWRNVGPILIKQPNWIKILFMGNSLFWPNVGAMLLNQRNKTILLANFGVNITRALRWPDVVQPTCAILYVGSRLAQCCKAIKVKGTDFQFLSNTMMLSKRCAPNANR